MSLLYLGDDVEQGLAHLAEGGGADAVDGVAHRVPCGAEPGVAAGAHVDDVDTGDAGLVDEDVVVGHGTAIGVDEVAAGGVIPHQVNKTGRILLRVVLVREGSIAGAHHVEQDAEQRL